MAMPLRRPTSLAEMRERSAGFMSDESRARGLAIAVRPDDVFVATYPKCGTTWMQQLLHTLRTRGDMAFDEISCVVPWLELAHDLGQDPDADQAAAPRVFKSHLRYEDVPKGGRCIHVMREPGAVAVSFFRFFEGWMFETGSVSLDDFVAEYFVGGSGSGKYWDHVLSWWPVRERDDVLVLVYEQMLADPAAHVHRVAEFTGIALDDALFDIALRHSSKVFMAAHASQFDDHPVRIALDERMDLPPTDANASTKVQSSAPAARHTLSADTRALLDARWRESVTPVLGFESYANLVAAL